jgi:hypothetical protein
VPFEEQQLVGLDSDLGLVLDEVELKELAARIREGLAQTGKDPAGA